MYAFAGYDESGVAYYQSEETGWYLYWSLYGDWNVYHTMDEIGVWKGTGGSSTSPLDATPWYVDTGSSWLAQPGVSASCAAAPPSPLPLSLIHI